MKVKDLNIGDVFKIISHPRHGFDPEAMWRKETNSQARVLKPIKRFHHDHFPTVDLNEVLAATIEVVERADTASIRRVGNTLVLKGGDVLFQFMRPFIVYRCTPVEKWTEFALLGSNFRTSETDKPSEKTALPFMINSGGKVLGRPNSSTIFAYKGRVYARATNEEITGKKTTAGYKRVALIDGSRRLILAGLLNIADDAALHDIIQDHFGSG
jgi:hypothetical protein